MNLFTVGMAPHRHGGRTIAGMVRLTFLGLAPVILAALYLFRGKALAILLVGLLAAVGTEVAIALVTRQKLKVLDGHSALLGVLLALMMPPGTPLWIVLVAGVLCVALGKMVFGNAWNYPFHPALVALVLVQISWPGETNTFYKPLPMLETVADDSETHWIEAADPIAATKVLPKLAQRANLHELIWGDHPGGIGLTSIVAIVLGALILIGARVVAWQIPFGFIGGAWVFAYIFYQMDPTTYPPPTFTLFAGALFFVAVFVATDWVTTPTTGWGMLLFGVGAGVLTVLIRTWGSAGEGAYFAVLIMNAAAPLLDRIGPVPFGRRLKTNA